MRSAGRTVVVAALALLVGCRGAAETPEAAGARVARLAGRAKATPGDAALLRELARADVALAREWDDAGSDPQLPLLDARDAFRRALEVAPNDDAALLEAAQVEAELDDAAACRALLLRHLAASPRGGAVRATEAARSELFARLGASAAAVRAAGRALAEDPEDVTLHQRRTDLCFRAGESELLKDECEALERTFPDSATATWYVGYARLLAGDAARRERRFADARRDYEAARSALAAAAARTAAYAEMSRRIDHLAALGLAWTALEEGDLAGAEAALLERLAQAPDLAQEPDGFRRSLIDALARVGADDERAGDLAAGTRVMRALAQAEPRRAIWFNDLGLFLREQALYRDSWNAYLEAARLAPDDARIVNDAALIQIYHLRDELDRAEKMLYEAIRIGEARLEALGADPPESARFPVAQAVGDAWQNLAYLYYHVRPDFPKVKECVERSIATRTDSREGLRVYVEAVEGRHEPIPERPVAAPRREAAAPRREAATKGQVAWQRSFDDARAFAAALHEPLLVYCRGEGLGVGVQFMDANVGRIAFANATTVAVCAVADGARHVACDRDSRGRRVLCPRYGVVTCGEHQRAYRELGFAWPSLRRADEGDAPIEGLLLVDFEGRRGAPIERGGRIADWIARAADPATASEREDPQGLPSLVTDTQEWIDWRPDLPDLLTDLLWNEGRAQTDAAAALVGRPDRASRAAVEALLALASSDTLPIGADGAITGHELVVPTSTVAALIDALAASRDASCGEILDAALALHVDPATCALALAHCPPRGDVERLKRIREWSDDAHVRARADAALRRSAKPDGGAVDRPLLDWLELVAAAER